MVRTHKMKETSDYKYIFGPVPSRRLGYSLGVDIVPYKTCSYDCIYCQLGRTTDKTTARREFFPVDDIVRELERKVKEPGKTDFITFSGSGEPTLHSGLGELVRAVKRLSDIPVAVLTNGSLLWDEGVREDLADADLIVPSLDAGSENVFRAVNRPCGGLDFKKVAAGIVDFCSRHRDKVWLEVFLVAGINSSAEEVKRINAIARGIRPAKVQLNTVDRPPAEPSAGAVGPEEIRALADLIEGNVEIIPDFHRPADSKRASDVRSGVLDLLRRRPCSMEDIAGSLNLHPNEVVKYLDELEKQAVLVVERGGKKTFYTVKRS